MKHLTNTELESRTAFLIKEERRICADLLLHFREIEMRRIYAERGFSSMFEYLVKGHGYSEGAAHRRIMASRSIETCPEIEDRIREGKISLTTAAVFHTFVKSEKIENPPEVLKEIEGLSKRETEKVFASIAPTYNQNPREKVMAINADDVEIRFVADKPLQEKFENLRNTFSHINPKLDYQKLFHLMADKLLGKSNLKQSEAAPKTPPEKLENGEIRCEQKSILRSELRSMSKLTLCSALPTELDSTSHSVKPAEPPKTSHSALPPALNSNLHPTTRHIPAHIRRNVFRRDMFQCTYKDLKTGRKCDSKFQLELDHIVPYSMGGKHTEENLQLRCACHNRLSAITIFGQKSAKFSTDSKFTSIKV